MSAPSFFRPGSEPPDTPTHCIARYVDGVLGLLAVKAGEQVLDVGCGDGCLSARLASQGAEVVGFDIDPQRVQAARTRGLEVKQGNAEELYFHQEFDAVFSHDALHAMHQADEVAIGAFMALKPGGRFVGEFPGSAHAALVRQALQGALERRSIDWSDLEQWYLPNAHDYQQVLEQAGFHVSHISWFEQPLLLDVPIAEWIKECCGHYLEALPPQMHGSFLEEVTEDLARNLLDPGGRWTVDATRLRFRAHRKA